MDWKPNISKSKNELPQKRQQRKSEMVCVGRGHAKGRSENFVIFDRKPQPEERDCLK